MKKRFACFTQNRGLLLLALILVATGMLLLLYPAESMKTLCYITAATTAVVGIVLMINALSFETKKGKYLLFLLAGALSFVSGILLFFAPENVFLFYTALVGLLLILNGGFALQSVVLSRQKKNGAWWVKLPLSLLVIFGGFLCVRLRDVGVDRLAMVFGLTLVFAGALNLLSFLTPSTQLQIVGKEKDDAENGKNIPTA